MNVFPIRALLGSVLAAAFALGLCAGAGAQDKKVFAAPRFLDVTPIKLDVRGIELVRDYAAPATKPHVEHLFPVSPADAVAQWASDRLKPAGTWRLARVVIVEASVVEVPLEKTGGIKGWFTTDQSERYDAVLEVAIELRSDRGRDAYATARVKRSQTVEEGISLAKRHEVWHQMTEKLMADLDRELGRSIQQYLATYIRP